MKNSRSIGTILIVEDQQELLEVYRRLLEKSGYRVLTATTGREAMKQVKEHQPHLILMDVVLPDASGFSLMKLIKSNPGTANTFVVLISARVKSPEQQSEGLESGADGYLVKPLHNRELVARVDAFMRHKSTIDQLAASEARFRKFAEKNLDGILVVDREGYIRYHNPASEKLFYHGKQLLTGALFGQPVYTGDSTTINIKTQEGYRLTAEMRAVDIEWDHESMKLVTLHDVTERMDHERRLKEANEEYIAANEELKSSYKELFAAHEQLIETEEDLRSFIEESPIALAITDPDGTCRFTNSALDKILGRKPGEANFRELIHKGRQKAWDLAFKQMNEGGSLHNFETGLEDKSGRTRQVNIDAVKLRTGKTLIYLTDNTGIKNIEKQLHEHQDLFFQIFNLSPLGIALIDKEQRIIKLNPALQKTLGFTEQELLNRDTLSLCHPEERDSFKTEVQRLFEGKKHALKLEKRCLSSGGKYIWVNLHLTGLINVQGHEPTLMCMIEDITDRKVRHSQLLELVNELEKRGRTNKKK